MAPTSHQPLLASPNHKRTSPCKVLLVLVSLVAIIGSLCLVAFRYTDIPPLSPTPLNVARICDRALDRNACLAMVLAEVTPDKSLEQLNGVHLLHTLLKKTTRVMKQTTDVANKARLKLNDPREQAALADCADLMDLSHNRLIRSADALKEGTSTFSLSNAHAWLSSILTNHVTCLDGLHGSSRSVMEPKLNELIARARASLAVMVAVTPTTVDELRPLRRGLPAWVTARDRKLLESPPNGITSNVVVAQDGSGDYKTIQEAVTAAPNNSDIRYVIYIKNGTYNEKVDIPVTKKNLMLTGDGMDLTVITGSLNVDDGSTTFNSATVAVVADRFIAQDLCFQNTAGPQKHQAVALRVGADRSVINRCKIDAYQDTLYTHSLRQFYRDCYITGTVDFIFGNAAVVFQNSQLVARKPMSGQGNMVTAQGRTDPNQNTGTSIQNCDVIASSDLEPVKGSIKSYLGRPWKEYSRTIVMQSNIGDHIDPAGWSVWSGDFALSTLYYGEYLNRGPGARTSQRVNWPGYHVITSASEAQNFTVASLIQGGSWLKDTGVSYTEGL